MHATGDQTGEVGHVDHEQRADLVGNRAEAGEVDMPGIGRAAGDDEGRLGFDCQLFHLVIIDEVSSSRTPYCTALNHLPDMAGLAPCVRWPPASSDMPRMVSPGLVSASITPPFACAPECGCTLAKPQLKSCFARSIASCSTSSDRRAALIVTLAGIAFGIFVGEDRALRFEHRRRRCSRTRSARSGSARGEVPCRSRRRPAGHGSRRPP
jgi:hypothetical protein